MNTDDAAKKIVEQLNSEDGFMIQLRVYNNFADDAFNNLIEAVDSYHRLLGDDRYIDREAISWLVSTLDIVRSLEQHYETISDPKYEKVQTARRKLSRRVHDLLDIGAK